MAGIRRRAAVTATAMTLLGNIVLTSCGGGTARQAGSPPTAPNPTTRPPLVAVLHAPGHHPRRGRRWPITVTVTWRGRPASGRISYQFLFAGAVVSRQPVRGESAHFRGVFHDELQWPATAVGYPITLRVVVTTPHGTKRIDYPVLVRR